MAKFHLFGSTSEQRQSARAVANATGGEIGDYFTKKIHVDYSTASKEVNPFTGEIRNVFTEHTLSFRTNGNVDYHNALFNDVSDYLINQQLEWQKNHYVDKNGNVHFIPASGGIRSVPVLSLMVPLPPVARILGLAKAAEVAEEGTVDFVTGVRAESFGKVIGEGTVHVKPTIDAIENGSLLPRNAGYLNRELHIELLGKPKGYWQEYHLLEFGGKSPLRILRGNNGEYFLSPNHYNSLIPLN